MHSHSHTVFHMTLPCGLCISCAAFKYKPGGVEKPLILADRDILSPQQAEEAEVRYSIPLLLLLSLPLPALPDLLFAFYFPASSLLLTVSFHFTFCTLLPFSGIKFLSSLLLAHLFQLFLFFL